MSDPTPAQPVDSPEPTTVEVPVEPKPVDPNSLFADQLAGIKAEDGRQKYADVATALASVPHAQDHIKAQADEIVALKEQVAKQQGMEALLEQLKTQQAPTEQNPSVQGLDETAVAAMLDSRLQQREQAALADANTATVLTTLSEKFGDKAEERFNEQASTLGVSVGFLSDLARKAPAAVLAYFDSTPSTASNPTEGSVESVLTPPPEPENRDYMRVFEPQQSDAMRKWKAVQKTA